MSTEVILTCILSSTLAAAIVQSIKELLIWRLNRKAKLQDDATEEDKHREQEHSSVKKTLEKQQKLINEILESLNSVKSQMAATVEHDKIILRDKIKYLIFKYLEYGKITFDEKQAIHHMWNIYHYDLGGNGDLDEMMQLLDELPVINTHVVGGCYGETHS